MQNVVVSSLFIAFLTFLTKGSKTISLLAAFGSVFSPGAGEVDRGNKRAEYTVTYPSKGIIWEMFDRHSEAFPFLIYEGF